MSLSSDKIIPGLLCLWVLIITVLHYLNFYQSFFAGAGRPIINFLKTVVAF